MNRVILIFIIGQETSVTNGFLSPVCLPPPPLLIGSPVRLVFHLLFFNLPFFRNLFGSTKTVLTFFLSWLLKLLTKQILFFTERSSMVVCSCIRPPNRRQMASWDCCTRAIRWRILLRMQAVVLSMAKWESWKPKPKIFIRERRSSWDPKKTLKTSKRCTRSMVWSRESSISTLK